MRTILTRLMLAGLVILGTGVAAIAQPASTTTPATMGLERLKALEGDWVDVDGAFGVKGAVAVTYRVTSGGTTVVERFPVNTVHEMITVYHLDGTDLVLTHFCNSGEQPRMRSKGLAGASLSFDPDGGTNVDPSKRDYMHSARIEFVAKDEIRGTWLGPADRTAVFRLVRKK